MNYGESHTIALLVKVAKAADKLEALLRKNTGRTDDWPIEIKVSEDYAKQLAGKLTALTRALKPYRKAKNDIAQRREPESTPNP